MKRRDWSAVTTDRHTPCRVCGSYGQTERAHVLPRQHERGKMVKVNPLDIVPLCGPSGDWRSCHYAYDQHRLDLRPYLTDAEWERAVEVAGSEEAARVRVSLPEHKRVAR